MNHWAEFNALLRAIPNLEGAACRGGDWHDLEFDAAPECIERATLTCQRCPAFDPCRAWVEATPPTKRPSGIVAGRFHIDGTGRPVVPTDNDSRLPSRAQTNENTQKGIPA